MSAVPASAGRKSPAFFSHTAQALAPVLAAGPHKKREVYNFAAAEAKRSDDLEIDDLGAEIKMPWEVDGRRWHTKERVSRSGAPCRWDGKILDMIEQKIQDSGGLSPTDWNSRTIVEITAPKKSDGWFFHAITGEMWLLKLKFRTAKKTFQRDELTVALGLKPLNDIPEIESYGHGPRVKCKSLRGPFQEVEIGAYSWQEIDTPEFWKFLESAIAGFRKFTERTPQSPEDVMPWKVLGRKWHLARKGFPPGKPPAWNIEVLEELLETLGEAASAVGNNDSAAPPQFLWNNQQVIHLMIKGQREPWATVHTKRPAGVDLVLNGPQGAFTTDRIAELGSQRAINSDEAGIDQVKFRFVKSDHLHLGDLTEFLAEHLQVVRAAGSRIAAS